jgi:hypothetical protein
LFLLSIVILSITGKKIKRSLNYPLSRFQQGCTPLRYSSPLLSMLHSVVLRCFLFFFFFSVMFARLPSPLLSVLSRSSAVGFSGSRSILPPALVSCAVFASVPASSSVLVGCAPGLDRCARLAFPSALVFSVSSFGSGRGAFARRSVAFVSALSAASAPVLVSFPGSSCPPGLVPSPVSGSCFCGLGSGSWASLAFAVGLGVPCFVWLPPSVSFPFWWSAVPLGGGWFAPAI